MSRIPRALRPRQSAPPGLGTQGKHTDYKHRQTGGMEQWRKDTGGHSNPWMVEEGRLDAGLDTCSAFLIGAQMRTIGKQKGPEQVGKSTLKDRNIPDDGQRF